MKKILLITIFINLTIFSFASSKGSNTGAVLRFYPSSEASGMGNTFVAIGNSIESIYYNPAALSEVKDKTFSANYTKWIFDLYDTSLGFVYPYSKHRFGCAIRYFYMGEIEEIQSPTDNFSNKTSLYNLIASVIYAYQIKENISVGVGLKNLIQSYTKNYNISSFAFDISGRFAFSKITAGINLLNIGPAVKIDDVSNSLPFTVKMGVGYILEKFKVGLDLDICNDSGVKLYLGGEYKVTDEFKLRLGYQQIDEFNLTKGLSLGIGYESQQITSSSFDLLTTAQELKSPIVFINYSITYLSDELLFAHRIGIGSKF